MSELAFEHFDFTDDYGPEKVVTVYEPRCGLEGIVVIDNSAAGPTMGGIRMAPDVSVEEVCRLARAMTWKNAMARLRHGGGKAGIRANPRTANREALIRQFGRAIRQLTDYIPAPDMGTNETAMAWIRDEGGRSVGLSRSLGGIPLDETGSTGFGLAIAAEVAEEAGVVELEGATVSIQGFGNVGRPAARFLAERGARLVSVTDLDGTICDPDGIDIDELVATMDATGGVTEYPRGHRVEGDAFLDLEVDFFVPAARPDVIDSGNAGRVGCKVVLQGANIPVTPAGERILHDRGVLSIPDFVANAGGIICGAVEYAGGSERQAFERIEDTVRQNTREVLELARAEECLLRDAAMSIAQRRVSEAMAYRRAD